jgi:hypothetical protein
MHQPSRAVGMPISATKSAKSGSAGAHSITSSARPSKDSGMVMPSALAVEVNEQFDLCGLLHG